MTAPLLLQLTPTLAGHLATAVRTHRQWAARVGLPAPSELAAVERLLADAATSRHGAPEMHDLFRLRDRPVVAPRLLTYGSAAEALSVSVRSVERLVAAGELRTVRIGSASRVPARALDDYIENLEGAA